VPIPETTTLPHVRQVPSRWSAAVFAGKAALLQLRRGVQDLGGRQRRLARDGRPSSADAVASSRTPLWSDTRPAELGHQLGKVHNLQRAVRMLDGTVIPAGETFSFWRQVGRASRARGFVGGRMLQQGCMVPAIGGGLCQLSNALYDAALQAGCVIVERHAHSRVVPGSAAMNGRDATVAWNYVDLRFRPVQALQLSVRLTADELVVRLLGVAGARPAAWDAPSGDDRPQAQSSHGRRPDSPAGRQAFLVDEAWPEFVGHAA